MTPVAQIAFLQRSPGVLSLEKARTCTWKERQRPRLAPIASCSSQPPLPAYWQCGPSCTPTYLKLSAGSFARVHALAAAPEKLLVFLRDRAPLPHQAARPDGLEAVAAVELVAVEIDQVLFADLQIDAAESAVAAGDEVERHIDVVLHARLPLEDLRGLDVVHDVVVDAGTFRPVV